MDDIIYSRQNSDGTFQEKWLTPSASHFVICGPCGDLTTFTGSFGGGGGDTVKVSVVDSTSDYLESKVQAGPNVYISKSVDGDGYETLHFSSSATGEFDDSHLVTTASFNEWTGSPESQFAGTASYTKVSETASYGLYFSASNHMVVVTGSDESLGYIDLYGGMLYGTSSWAISASWAPTQVVDFSPYLSSSEFNDWTGSTESQFSGTSSFAISASWAPTVGGDFYSQGGNAFGATGVLGLTDNYDLNLVANNTTRMAVNRNDISFYTSGSYSFENHGPVAPTLRLYDADGTGDEYCQIRGRRNWSTEDYGSIGIGLNCFVSSSDWNVYGSLVFGNNAMRDHRGAENTWNIVIGHDSLRQSDPDSWDTTWYNLIVGHETLKYSGGDNFNNVLVGHSICEQYVTTASSDIWSNVVVGTAAARRVNGVFIQNTIVGEWAAYNMRSGSNNTLIGQYAAGDQRYLVENVAIGISAMEGLDNARFTGSYGNTAIGNYALSTINDQYNTMVGWRAGHNLATGKYNIAVGVDSHRKILPGASFGSHNISLGFANFHQTTRGNNNIAIGSGSMWYGPSGSGNIGIGYQTFRSLTGGSDNIAFGNKSCELIQNYDGSVSSSIAFGHGSSVEKSGEVVFGSSRMLKTSISSSVSNFTGSVSSSIFSSFVSNPTWVIGYFTGSTGASITYFSGSENGTPIVRNNYWFFGSENLDGYISGSVSSGGINGRFVGWLQTPSMAVNGYIETTHSQTYPQISLIRPATDNVTDLGSNEYRWKDIYLSGSIHIDGEFFTGSKTEAVGEFLKVIVDGNERWLQLYV